MKNRKMVYLGLTLIALIGILGLTYAAITYQQTGGNSQLVLGDIYMHYDEGETITLTNVVPMTKEEALERTDNIFNFQITGKNTSSKDVYYGISLETGEVPEGKIGITPSDLVVYLESDGNVLVDSLRYQDFSGHIYVDTISKETTSQITKDYKLRVWLRDGIIVSDTIENATYTSEEWENVYMSLKVKVDGNLVSMNMPLSLEHDNKSVENNKQYFITTIKNYLNPEEVGEVLNENENMKLEITSDDSNILFSYKDSRGNLVEEASETLSIDYIFNKKESIETQVFITPLNENLVNSDIIVKLTTSDNQVYTQVINMDIKGTNYCLSNGFNKLTDCILVSENLSNSVTDAKTYISSKTYNLNDTAPSYTYVEDVTYGVVNPELSTTADGYYIISDTMKFDEATGVYKLESSQTVKELSENLLNKYICSTSDAYGRSTCLGGVKVLELSSDTKTVTKGDVYSYKISNVLESEVGLYKTVDDYGDTYFYRGDVKNNNVYFGGYYWKIVRINGDNSIRLIYNGTSSDSSGINSVINEEYSYYASYNSENDVLFRIHPMYQGYMFGDTFSSLETVGAETKYLGFTSRKYKFAETYQYDDSCDLYQLSGTIVEKTYDEMKTENLLETYPFFCASVSSEGYCEAVSKIKSYTDSEVFVEYIYHLPIDEDEIKNNEKDSGVKVKIDEWYEKNIYNKTNTDGTLLEKYIVDGTFCNDRSISTGDAYNLDLDTYFSSVKRFGTSINSPILTCSNDIRDKFSQTSAYGNADLKYPIALLTADEVALAGGKYAVKNSDYYLNSSENFWTMTPSHYSRSYFGNNVYTVYDDGTLHRFKTINTRLGIRPVININSNILISTGDGSLENPYELKLS